MTLPQEGIAYLHITTITGFLIIDLILELSDCKIRYDL